MKYILFLCFTCITLTALCQDKQISGVVADKSTQERIARVNIQNIRTGKSTYNNLKAEFSLKARPGDMLIFSRQGYFTDTVKITGNSDMAVYLKPTAILLREVKVRDSLLTPGRRLAIAKAENSKAYGSLAYRDILSISPVGAGISIDALWNMISRSGRNAAHLRELIEQDNHQDVIDYRYSKTFVAGITGLKEPDLTRFMQRYRPSYYLVSTASDYDFIAYIKGNLKRYQHNPHGMYLQPLTPVTTAAQ